MTRAKSKRNHIAAMLSIRSSHDILSVFLLGAFKTEVMPPKVRGIDAKKRREDDRIYDLACKYPDHNDSFFPMHDLDSTTISPELPEENMPVREAVKPRCNYRSLKYNSIGKDMKMDTRRRHNYLKDLRVGKRHKVRTLRQQRLVDDEVQDIMDYM
jgi:hypothetical protein